MELWDIALKVFPAGAFAAIFYGLYQFYRRHLLNIEIYSGSEDTYCFVLDSERNDEKGKTSYFAQLKATLEFSAGSSIAIDDVHFVLEDQGRACEVSFSEPTGASSNVREFFGLYGKDWNNRDAADSSVGALGSAGRLILSAKGVASRHDSFSNRPDGRYVVTLVIVLRRFSVVVPCRFASFRGSERSTICGRAKVYRKLGHEVNPVALAEETGNEKPSTQSIFRLQLAILDFDFLPGVSWFKAIPIKTERI